jgi:hypothetical protein
MSGDFVIKYGTPSCNIDVTEIALQRCVRGNLLYIPADEILKRNNYQWFARLSAKQALASDTTIGKYLLIMR